MVRIPARSRGYTNMERPGLGVLPSSWLRSKRHSLKADSPVSPFRQHGQTESAHEPRGGRRERLSARTSLPAGGEDPWRAEAQASITRSPLGFKGRGLKSAAELALRGFLSAFL